MNNFSNLLRFAISFVLIGISLVVLIMLVFLHAITDSANNYLFQFLFFIIIPFSIGIIILFKAINKLKQNKIASLELQLINLAKRHNGIITIPDASTKLNKSIEQIENGFKSLEGKDIFEINANEKGGLEYRLLN